VNGARIDRKNQQHGGGIAAKDLLGGSGAFGIILMAVLVAVGVLLATGSGGL
jgi:hypothetical protein